MYVCILYVCVIHIENYVLPFDSIVVDKAGKAWLVVVVLKVWVDTSTNSNKIKHRNIKNINIILIG